MNLKRFLLFSGYVYYASGGWSDFVGSYRTIEEARAAIPEEQYSTIWHHIVDADSGEIVESSETEPQR